MRLLPMVYGRTTLPERMCNEKYIKMPIEEYVSEAYARACRVASLVIKHEGMRYED